MLTALAIYAVLTPSDIKLPPEHWRSTQGAINVVYVSDPAISCRSNTGMITLACTLGERPNAVVTILMDPCLIDRSAFASALCKAPDRDTLLRDSCRYTGDIYARLACHEVIGHQLGRWPADHPRH